MATLVPNFNSCKRKMTSGEKRFAERLIQLLEDDYICWYDIPIGKKQRYPDFIILHPSRGLLFLEVKDWKLENIRSINKTSVDLLSSSGLKTRPNPFVQARQYVFPVTNLLEKDPLLQNINGKYKGNLCFPWGYGVVYTNITREALNKYVPTDSDIFPSHLMICKDEMLESSDAEEFQTRLWNMFPYQFGDLLTLPQINRIRWHLFPEIRITTEQTDLFSEKRQEKSEYAIPDIVKVMDLKQEQLARNMGNGHRVIHGVAGSGKTMILGYRCLYLAKLSAKPILVLCYNVTLATKLRAFIESKCISEKVNVLHFHDWCGQQLKTYNVTQPKTEFQFFEQQVLSVIKGVEQGHIPRGQYGAVMIDEGHDFEEAWLKLIVQMVDPESNNLLLLYDDAQSIYKKDKGLGFALSSVGVQARGRTTVLKLNYRNTKEILKFAYSFAKKYQNIQSDTKELLPLIEPEAAGLSGLAPVFKIFNNQSEEMNFLLKCLNKWYKKGENLNDIVVLYPKNYIGKNIANALMEAEIPYQLLSDTKSKKSYKANENCVSLMTMHSSKGLEFKTVIIFGLCQLDASKDKIKANAKVLYVGMTRAEKQLLLTASKRTLITEHLLKMA